MPSLPSQLPHLRSDHGDPHRLNLTPQFSSDRARYLRAVSAQFDIGILTGSGPEAGIDLWNRVLEATRSMLGDAFGGDADAPAVLVRSDPRLGVSMDLDDTADSLWPIMLEHAQVLDAQSGAWAIACNTLNHYAGQLADASVAGALVSFPAVVADKLDDWGSERVALLGARPVAALGENSAYAALADRFVSLAPEVLDDLHSLIHDIKIAGPSAPELRVRLGEICDGIEADRFVLACTEFPLVADPDDARLVDVTQLVAAALVDRWLGRR